MYLTIQVGLEQEKDEKTRSAPTDISPRTADILQKIERTADC